MSAILSACGLYRYRLDRTFAAPSSWPTYAFFGVNASTADATRDDHTVRKWIGFCRAFKARRFVVGNVFAFRATDVRELALAADPIGPANDRYLAEIIAEADILVPCWGSRGKLPRHLRPRLDDVADMIWAAGKPVKCFGVTGSNDPKHPLTLGYSTPLVDWWRR